jgi:hypothetical protein
MSREIFEHNQSKSSNWFPALSVSKSNGLHAVIYWSFFIEFEADFMNSSQMIGDFPAVLNFNRLLFKLSLFICN